MNPLRRHVLIALSLLPMAVPARERRDDPALLRLLRVYDDPVAARRLGAAYLETRSSSMRATLDAVMRNLGVDERRLAGMPEREFRERVSRTIAGDFDSGRVATVGGWCLARTELDLCGLYCLAYGRG